MSEKKDVYSDVKSQMRLSERIAAAIPGFHGYKEKEIRRESDRLIRNHLNLKLTAAKSDLKTISQKVADRRYFDVMTDLDRLNAKMDRVAEKVNHASYGYTGLFDAVKVKEEALDRMIQFDSNLIDEITAVSSEVTALKTELGSGETKNLKAHIQTVTDKLEALEATFDSRDEVIKGVN
jgi:hypothetical protein